MQIFSNWQKIMDFFIAENYDAIQKLIDDEKAEEYDKNDFTSKLQKFRTKIYSI